jgi:Major Facilitator Superfamily
VFASLMVSLIADGVSFSFGLIYSELLDYFQEGTTKTAWVGSLFMSVPLLVGPIMSNLVDKYGCQKMTMLGGLLGCAGFALSSFSNSVEILFVTFGLVAGLGLGVIYVTAVVSIAFWFESKRTFATGIGASGTGIGTFIYAPFTQWLISYYGWRGATLILGGTLLNFCVFGALMIDPDWLIEENKLEARSQSIQTFSNSSMYLDEIKKLIETGAPKEDLLDTLVTNFNTEANQQIQDPDIVHSKKYQSEVLLPTFISNNEIDHFDGIKSSSRRSLRPDKLKSPETISREEFLSPFLNKTVVVTGDVKASECGVNKKKCKIASIETLNTSEKASTNADFDVSLINLSLDDHMQDLGANEDEFVTCRSGMHGSRFSLNETFFTNPPSLVENFKRDLRHSFRGNSLNIVYENEMFQPNYQSSPSKVPNGNASDIVIPMQNSVAKLRRNVNKTHKQSTTMPAGNLKRNPSLRYSNYLKNMRVHRNSIHYRGAMLNTHRYRLKASSCPNIYRNSMTTIAKEDEVSTVIEILTLST